MVTPKFTYSFHMLPVWYQSVGAERKTQRSEPKNRWSGSGA